MKSEDITVTQNKFLRQFESHINNHLIAIEYTDNGRNIFLSKVNFNADAHDEDMINLFIKAMLDDLKEKEITIVPTSSYVKKFIRRNRLLYKKMLPTGMAI